MLKLLNIILVLYLTNNWNILVEHHCSGYASTSFSEYCENTYELREMWAYKLLARSSFEIDSWTRQENKKVSYPKCSRRLVLNSYDKCYIVTLI